MLRSEVDGWEQRPVARNQELHCRIVEFPSHSRLSQRGYRTFTYISHGWQKVPAMSVLKLAISSPGTIPFRIEVSTSAVLLSSSTMSVILKEVGPVLLHLHIHFHESLHLVLHFEGLCGHRMRRVGARVPVNMHGLWSIESRVLGRPVIVQWISLLRRSIKILIASFSRPMACTIAIPSTPRAPQLFPLMLLLLLSLPSLRLLWWRRCRSRDVALPSNRLKNVI